MVRTAGVYEHLCVCLPLQAVRGAAAGFHLHFGPDAQWSEGQAAGQSLQTSAWTWEGPAEGESGTVTLHRRAGRYSPLCLSGLWLSSCCFPADVHVQLRERRGLATLHRFTFRNAALLQVSDTFTIIHLLLSKWDWYQLIGNKYRCHYKSKENVFIKAHFIHSGDLKCFT